MRQTTEECDGGCGAMPAGEDRGRALRDHRARGKPSRPVPEKEGREIITNSDGKLPVDEGAVDLVCLSLGASSVLMTTQNYLFSTHAVFHAERTLALGC